MFLRCTQRKKDGKEHRYRSIVENRRCAGGKIVQRPVLYLGEVNDSQREGWCRVIEGFDEDRGQQRSLALFAWDREVPDHATDYGVQVRLKEFELHRARQWGACWLACELYEQLGLHGFWTARLPDSREGTCWRHILQTLVCYRLIEPGSEWRLHRQWFEQSAMGDLLGEDYSLVEKNALYRSLDKLLFHKSALFDHLSERWKDLFGAKFDVLLYDLTSTYFESDPPFPEGDKRQFGYSRDKRPDCVQVVIALIVTPEGFPLAYEVLAGNTSDKTTLKDFLKRIEDQYGKAQRIWVMDRGIPTEEVLQEMRGSDPPVYYLVGTPKARLKKFEAELLGQPWKNVREGVDVKLQSQEGELYVFAQSRDRVAKERSMRVRQLRGLLHRLKALQIMRLSSKNLLLKLGEAKARYRGAWRLFDFNLPEAKSQDKATGFGFRLNRKRLREARRREGRYLLRTNLCKHDPVELWSFYIQLVEIEAVFKNLKDDLSLRPFFHRREDRIEAHIFVAFLAYCLQVTLRARLRALAPGLTPRAVLEKFAAIQMLDVHFPTTDGRTLILSRYTQPEADQKILLEQLRLQLPAQPPPRITSKGTLHH
ncbi:MAG TPA: IS1634 family transposase [Terrimicrobiaceae bacterium]